MLRWANAMQKLCLVMLLSLLPVLSMLSMAADTQTEIDHLLTYLTESGCTYVRNGSEHSASEAVEHILKKYRYFEDDIDTTEQFIELSASESTFTGRDYLIRCPGQPEQPSRDWLLAELQRYRQQE